MIKPSSGLVMVMVGGWLDWAKAGGTNKAVDNIEMVKIPTNNFQFFNRLC